MTDPDTRLESDDDPTELELGSPKASEQIARLVMVATPFLIATAVFWILRLLE